MTIPAGEAGNVITKGGFALEIYTGLGVRKTSYETPEGEMENWLDDLNLTNKFTVSVPFGFTFATPSERASD